jgi:hypothetical protein
LAGRTSNLPVGELTRARSRCGELQQHLVNGGVELALVHPGAHRGVALGIKVHQQRALAVGGQRGGEIDGGGGLAHPALLVGDGENMCMFRLSR